MADRVVAVARAANELTAGMLAGLLADNGIRCGTKNVGAGLAYATPALDPHEILVLESEVQRAAAILAPYAGNDLTLLVPAPPIDDEAAQ
jgi:hypothetical protein